MVLSLWRSALIALAVLSSYSVLPGQSTRLEDLGIGKLLVARRAAQDPIFGETVILLVRYANEGTVGLVVNRPTRLPISALPDLSGSKQRSDPVYLGGPVDAHSLMALLRVNTMPEEAIHVSGKVYLVSSKALLEKSLARGAGPAELHVYVGYSGWSKGQLEEEVEQGVWYIFPGNADLAFDPEPETLWSRLVARGERQIARAHIPTLASVGLLSGSHRGRLTPAARGTYESPFPPAVVYR